MNTQLASRLCYCGNTVPEGKRRDAIYCSKSCRDAMDGKTHGARRRKKYAAAHPDKIMAMAKVGRNATKHKLILYKGGQCQDCGSTYPDVCFHFDHRIPDEKSFNVCEALAKPWSCVSLEADKCDLVCANCHAIRTAGNPDVSTKIKRLIQFRAAEKCLTLMEA